MKRKTSSVPTRIYVYGVHPRGITEGQALADDQYCKADDYRTKLVTLELERRTAVRAVLDEAPTVIEIGQRVAREEATVETLYKQAREANAAARKRTMTAETRQTIKEAKAQLAVARKAWKAERSAAAADPPTKARLDEIEARHHARIIEERAASDLYWGTYLVCEKAAEQQRKALMDPRHKPRTGEGRIAVQIQKGMTVARLAGDRRFRMRELPGTRRSRGKYLAECSLRAGSVGRDPLWVTFTAVVHRPLPDDAKIMWAWLYRWRRGRAWAYELHITVESREFAQAVAAGEGRVALDLGWRVAEKGNGGLRVAYWKDDKGNEGEVRLDNELLSALDYPSQLLGVETHWFEKMRGELVTWAKANTLPPEHAARLENLAQWRNAKRLSSAVWWWKDNRFAGDEAIFSPLNEWRVRRFWHYRDWSINQREKALARRLDFYRMFARTLLARYDTLVLEDFDLRKFAAKPKAEDAPVPNAERYWRMMGSPHELRIALIDTARKLGRTFVKLDPAMTTRRCDECGCEDTWDQSQLMHTCAACGRVRDQDLNACNNLLALSAKNGART
jgi:hypothetical protein